MKGFLLNALIIVLSWLPLTVLRAIGYLVGAAVWRFSQRNRQITEMNLRLCFPDQSSEWREAMGRKSMINTGQTLVEAAAMWRWPEKRLCKLVTQVHNQDLFSDACKKNRGVILVTPHIGAWELIPIYIGSQQSFTSVYRPTRSTTLNPILRDARERFGNSTAALTASGLRQLLKTIKQGQAIGILPDQEPEHGHGTFAPFFGVPAYTMTLLGNLAYKSDACVVFCVMKRAKKGYELHFVNTEISLLGKNCSETARSINQAIESCIDVAPEQYLWSYKRFSLTKNGKRRQYLRSH